MENDNLDNTELEYEEFERSKKPHDRVPPRMRLLFYENGTTGLVSTKKPLINPAIIALRVNMGDRLLKDIGVKPVSLLKVKSVSL